MELKSNNSFTVKKDGKEYTVNYPTVRVIRSFDKETKDGITIDNMISFLVMCGLEEDFVLDLDTDDMKAIVNTLLHAEKK